MAESCVIELESKYLTDEEICLSDDSDVRVANMNGSNDNEIFPLETSNDKSCVIANNDDDDDEEEVVENEIVSDDEYNYSDDSVCSEDSCRGSEMTNVTPRSSQSARSPVNLDYPIGRFNEIDGIREASYPRQFSSNIRDNIRRMCASVNDDGYSNGNVARLDATSSRARRRNMSFTNAEMRRIEVENQYLLKKIMAQQKPQNKCARTQSALPRVSSSAINRRKLQKRIDEENMMLLRRIQEAKSCAVSGNVIPGYRLTSL